MTRPLETHHAALGHDLHSVRRLGDRRRLRAMIESEGGGYWIANGRYWTVISPVMDGWTTQLNGKLPAFVAFQVLDSPWF
jgi:hypothetical protein